MEGLGHFQHRLGQGRVGVDGLHNHPAGESAPHGQGNFMDHIRGMGTDDVGSQNLVGLSVGDDLHQTFQLPQALAHPQRFEGKAGHLDRVFGLGFLFRNPHGGVLRQGEGAAGHDLIIHRAPQTQGVLRGADAFGKGHVGQQPAADDVTRGINARHIGHHVFVHHDAPLLQFDAQLFQAEALGVEASARRQEDGVRAKLGAVVKSDW